MPRPSMLVVLKTLPAIFLVGCLFYLFHTMLHSKMARTWKMDPPEQISDLEMRTLEQLRLQVKKNQLLRLENDQLQQQLKQKTGELDKMVDQQKRLTQAKTKKPKQTNEVREQKTTTLQIQNQQKQEQPNQQSVIVVQGQRVNLHPSVKTVPSEPPGNSTSSSTVCLPLPQSQRPVTICIHDPKTDNMISGSVQAGQLWEHDFVIHLDRVLLAYPDMGLVDIGANIGIYTLVAAANGRDVLSVDIQDTNILLLQRSLFLSKLSSQVTLVNNAIYKDHNSKLSYTTFQNNVARAVIVDNAQLPSTVQSTCLDDLIPLVRSKSVLLKIDMENSEHHVLIGGLEFFKRINVQIVQIKWGGRSQEVIEQIKTFMSHFGFSPNILMGRYYHLWDMVSGGTDEVFFLKRGL